MLIGGSSFDIFAGRGRLSPNYFAVIQDKTVVFRVHLRKDLEICILSRIDVQLAVVVSVLVAVWGSLVTLQR